MSISVGGDSDEVMSNINTTPLVDVMLVMLIIFLITVPVIVPSVKVELPEPRNIAQQTKPEDIAISVDVDGNFYMYGGKVDGRERLFELLAEKTRTAYGAGELPPAVHLKVDRNARYEQLARALYTIQSAGVLEIAFLTEPKGAGG
ncbi:MAG: biopolymer transporter ExbD [Steroidobacteraceae bacterium]